MTAEPPADLAKMISDGLTSYNADEFVPMPELPPLTFTERNVSLSFTLDEFGDVTVVSEWKDTEHGHQTRITGALGQGQLLKLYEEMIKPLMERDAAIGRLAAAADAVVEAEQQQNRSEREAHEAASAFRLQRVESRKVRGSTYPRLHRHTCHVLDKAEYRGTTAVTLDELLAEHFPAWRNRFEFLVSEEQVGHHYRTRANRRPMDNTVIALCGHCRPIGGQSKPVSDMLEELAHQVAYKSTAMDEVVRLLVVVENGVRETDAQYRESQS